MSERVVVEFEVTNKEEFLKQLQSWDDHEEEKSVLLGFRADDALDKRVPVKVFSDEMEKVLRRHEHKTTWREKPVEALFKLLRLEVEEASVALDHFSAAEARHEMIDIANFACILYDRLGMLKQEKTLGEQK